MGIGEGRRKRVRVNERQREREGKREREIPYITVHLRQEDKQLYHLSVQNN